MLKVLLLFRLPLPQGLALNTCLVLSMAAALLWKQVSSQIFSVLNIWQMCRGQIRKPIVLHIWRVHTWGSSGALRPALMWGCCHEAHSSPWFEKQGSSLVKWTSRMNVPWMSEERCCVHHSTVVCVYSLRPQWDGRHAHRWRNKCYWFRSLQENIQQIQGHIFLCYNCVFCRDKFNLYIYSLSSRPKKKE